MISHSKNCKAMTLLVVIYVVAALTTLAFALAFRCRITIKESKLVTDQIQQDEIALAAYTQACSVLRKDDDSIDYFDELWHGWHNITVPTLIDDSTEKKEGTWQAKWRLIDESSKINVNLAYPDILLGLECLDEAAAASILDWIDQDNIPNPDGAEDDYYAGIKGGYECRDGPLWQAEELLLIKGISPQIYFGSNLIEDDSGAAKTGLSAEVADIDSSGRSVALCDLITVYGDGKININTACKDVLAAIPLLSDSAIDEIVRRQAGRDGKFSSTTEIESEAAFSDADKLTLLQIARFNTNHFQFQVKVRKEGQQNWAEYSGIVERNGSKIKMLGWQRRLRPFFKKQNAVDIDNSTTLNRWGPLQ